MKLLLVSGSAETNNLLSHYLKPIGFEIIRYNHLIKAMDNIDEIDPNAIVISARDFPRQWKAMVQFVRAERSKDACPIVILHGELFPTEEASKASYLGVNGVITEELDSPEEIDRIQSILGRYLPLSERRRNHRLYVESWHKVGFAFSRPGDKVIVTGEIKDISTGGFAFLADIPSLMEKIFLNAELENCSFRAGSDIISPVCRLARTGRIVSLEFLSFPPGEEEILTKYIENLPLLDLSVRNERSRSGCKL